MAPARTGRDRSSKTAVMVTAQTNRDSRSGRIPFHRMLIAVVIKFKAPRIEDTPARWREKIAKSTDGPEWARFPERGGYTVHPVPTPSPISAEDTSMISAGGRSQNLMLFSRGNAMSGAPSINGRSQFPKPPINIGMTRKKIIRNACAVTIVL